MIRVKAFVASITVVLAGCSAPNPRVPLPVTEVRDHIVEWDGRIVTVEGWLGRCGGLDCGIYPTLADAQIVAQGNMSTNAEMRAMDRRLDIGFDDAFEAAAKPLQFKAVRLKARLNKECYPHKCKDRADILQPISIEPVE